MYRYLLDLGYIAGIRLGTPPQNLDVCSAPRAPEMCKGYRHQINFLVASLTEKIDHLESTVIKGAKDERVIKPEMDEVQKAMEKYQKGMKTIKAAFVFCLNLFRTCTTLIRVIGARATCMTHLSQHMCVGVCAKAPPKGKKAKAAPKKAASTK